MPGGIIIAKRRIWEKTVFINRIKGQPMDDQFIDFAKALAARQLKARKKGSILKSDEIRPVERKRVIGDDCDKMPAIEPILDENQEIQGIVVTCSCGQKINVYFEYQEETRGTE